MAVSTTPSPTPTSTPRPAPTTNNGKQEEEEEEDYMSMTITEPALPKEKETYTQRRIRKQREAEAKSHPPSKAALASLAATARTTALTTSLPQTATNKGFAIMAKLGYQAGASLGSGTAVGARTEPLELVVKEDRGGIGLDSERKRKVREEAEREGKRVKAEESEYRERVRSERELRRVEGLVVGAMGVVERLDCEALEQEQEQDPGEGEGQREGGEEGEKKTKAKGEVRRPTKSVNVLWRGLLRRREEKERERRMRYDLQQSLSRAPTYVDPEADRDDRLAVGDVEEEVEEEDVELDAFEALEPAERLRRLVGYLRGRYRYCFWCKCGYPDEGMEGCPGITEDDHD